MDPSTETKPTDREVRIKKNFGQVFLDTYRPRPVNNIFLSFPEIGLKVISDLQLTQNVRQILSLDLRMRRAIIIIMIIIIIIKTHNQMSITD